VRHVAGGDARRDHRRRERARGAASARGPARVYATIRQLARERVLTDARGASPNIRLQAVTAALAPSPPPTAAAPAAATLSVRITPDAFSEDGEEVRWGLYRRDASGAGWAFVQGATMNVSERVTT
jgi:hypothetical protein